MTNHRTIITVDEQQVAILDVQGIIPEYVMTQYKRKFAADLMIGVDGVSYVNRTPRKGLKKWKP